MRTAGFVTNLSVLLTFLVAALLYVYDEPRYYLAVQQYEFLEWAGARRMVESAALLADEVLPHQPGRAFRSKAYLLGKGLSFYQRNSIPGKRS